MRTLSVSSTVRAVRRRSRHSQDHHHRDHVADDGLQITLRRIVQNVRPEIVQNVWPEIVRTIGRQTAFCKNDKMKIAMAAMESQRVQFPLVETREEEEIDSSTSGEVDDDTREKE
mmetsp:Transcript_162497/g.516213  ORF Transcript_162497/g.516213 Transcript_162497/m.516213 type:complete len:115 (+) Transcript_162497:154-498(+)